MTFRSRTSVSLFLVFTLAVSRLSAAQAVLASQTAHTLTAGGGEGSTTVGAPYSSQPLHSYGLAVSWSQLSSSDADISVRLYGKATGNAYLMYQSGPNTTGRMPVLTIADEVVSSTFSFDNSTGPPGDGNIWVALFKGLALKPGSYYLVVNSAAGPDAAGSDSCCYGWGATDTRNRDLITAPGVTYNGSFLSQNASPYAGYPPASFSPWNAALDDPSQEGFLSLEFEVTGSIGSPPSITSLTAAPNVLWPPNNKLVPVSMNVTATGDPSPTCQISSVTSNEGTNSPGEHEWVVTGPLTVTLLARRAGSGDGRAYTITVTCTNLVGSAAQTVIVNVRHNEGQ